MYVNVLQLQQMKDTFCRSPSNISRQEIRLRVEKYFQIVRGLLKSWRYVLRYSAVWQFSWTAGENNPIPSGCWCLMRRISPHKCRAHGHNNVCVFVPPLVSTLFSFFHPNTKKCFFCHHNHRHHSQQHHDHCHHLEFVAGLGYTNYRLFHHRLGRPMHRRRVGCYWIATSSCQFVPSRFRNDLCLSLCRGTRIH
jgi:hypothetical protein